jgi:hypothetical protein
MTTLREEIRRNRRSGETGDQEISPPPLVALHGLMS